MEMAPSKVPGRKPKPWPMSWRKRSPSTSRSSATSACQLGGSRCQLTQHARGNVHSDPDVSILVQDLAAQTASTPNVEQVARLSWWQLQELKSTIGHLCLNVLHTGAVVSYRLKAEVGEGGWQWASC